MKSFLFTTDNDRGGVILCDIDTLPEAVDYLKQRFKGVVRVEQGRDYWSETEGFGSLPPASESSGSGQATPGST
ncbi:hypothetical protein [Neptuniibacter halophilus]|uniref:hypothetical protein n=1 Tax=Neptuniibacter halophilus TaxID=651666 RepID=UPI002572A81C|nr:hypothetical protein [Neptuniibacter halophilus]